MNLREPESETFSPFVGVDTSLPSREHAYIDVIRCDAGRPTEVEMVLAQLEVRCTACRGGLVCADLYAAWYARCDEVEAAWLAEHGTIGGLDSSPDWLDVIDERPDGDEEIECVQCEGSGVLLTDAGIEVLAWARTRLHRTAA